MLIENTECLHSNHFLLAFLKSVPSNMMSEIIICIHLLFFAGHETPSNAICWTLLCNLLDTLCNLLDTFMQFVGHFIQFVGHFMQFVGHFMQFVGHFMQLLGIVRILKIFLARSSMYTLLFTFTN
jgi:hypothetical protein